jgi:hypothetical protein
MAGEHPPSFDARLYRAALHLCPGEFRREHGEEDNKLAARLGLRRRNADVPSH